MAKRRAWSFPKLAFEFFPHRPGHHHFGKHIGRHLPMILVFAAIVAALGHLGLFQSFQTTSLDLLLVSRAPQESQQIVIVTIGDEEYKDPALFNQTSPLDSARLQGLLEAIAAGAPRVIAIDIDSSSSPYRGRSWPRALWSCDGDPIEDGAQDEHSLPLLRVIPALGGELDPRLKPQGADGQAADGPTAGMIILPRDSDGIIRHYSRVLQVAADEQGKPSVPVDSMAWAAVKEFTRRAPPDARPSAAHRAADESNEANSGHELLLNFAGDRYAFRRVPARAVLAGAKQDWWKTRSPLRDKIVLLGGTYRAARDEYITPVGPMAGVELIAQAIESDLQGGGIRATNEVVAIVLDIISGLLLVYLNWRFPTTRVLFLSMAVCGLALAGSFLAFRALAYWFNFALFLLAIWLHLQYDGARQRRELQHELAEYRKRYGSLLPPGEGGGAAAG
jgi:CHASE2 domain-containing sensor protein